MRRHKQNEEMSRAELVRALNNLELFRWARFFEPNETGSKDRLKQQKQALKANAPEELRKTSAVAIRKLSSALRGGCNFGASATSACV